MILGKTCRDSGGGGCDSGMSIHPLPTEVAASSLRVCTSRCCRPLVVGPKPPPLLLLPPPVKGPSRPGLQVRDVFARAGEQRQEST